MHEDRSGCARGQDQMSTSGSISNVYSPIIVGPVVRVGGAAFWVTANPGDVGDLSVVDTVS